MRAFEWSEKEIRQRIRVTKTGCWQWQRATNADGYGIIFHRGRHEKSHRMSWRLFHGDIPPGMHVLHRCDNPPCCNPEHLFLGVPADNDADKIKKGRAVYVRGSAVTISVLTEESVAALRADRDAGMRLVDVARKYGCSVATASKAHRRDTWRHVA